MTRIYGAVVFLLLVVSAGAVTAGELDLLPIGDAERATRLLWAAEGEFVDGRSGQPVTFEQMVEGMATAHVVLLGEQHTDMVQKKKQAEIIDALAQTGRPLVLGMEFFQRGDQDAIDSWLSGDLEDDALLKDVGWYDRGSTHFDYTRLALEVARNRNIKVVGVNVPREIVRTVNRDGLESLSEEQRVQVGEIVVGNSPEHRHLVSRYFGDAVAQYPQSWLDNMYAAQCVWDIVMARSILEFVREGSTVVVVVGSGHVAYNLGIVRRLREETSGTELENLEIRTYCPVHAPVPDPDGQVGHPMGGGGMGSGGGARPAFFVGSLADYVAVFPDPGGVEAFPRLGLSTKEGEDGGLYARMVWPDTRAEDIGFSAGDRLVEVNGKKPTNLNELRRMLAELEWGSRLDVVIERGEKRQVLASLLFPDVGTEERTVPKGWAVDNLLAFDPLSVEPAAPLTESEKSAVENARLVSRDGRALRVEVRRGEHLAEVHELDGNGWVIRSLYKEPREDGSVEVRYERGEDGKVTNSQRFGRNGEK